MPRTTLYAIIALSAWLMTPAVLRAQTKLEFKDGSARQTATLSVTDAKDPVRKRPAKVFTIELQGGKAYQIDMTKLTNESTIDPYLRLEDAKKTQLAEDDDGGELLNARILFNCPADGTYRIICTSFGGSVGPFAVTVKETVAVKLTELKLTDGKAEVSSALTETDGKDSVRTVSAAKVFQIKLAANKVYQIDMVSKAVDSYLRLTDAKGKQLAKDDDSGGFPNARIVFTPPAEGTYQIIATTFGGGIGEYTLSVKEAGAAKPVQLFKGSELKLTDGKVEINTQLTNEDPKDMIRKFSAAKVFTVKLAANKSYQIDMMSKAIDSYLRLEDEKGKKLAEDDDGGDGLNARIVFTPPVDGTYRIIATTFVGGVGNFTLSVKEAAK